MTAYSLTEDFMTISRILIIGLVLLGACKDLPPESPPVQSGAKKSPAEEDRSTPPPTTGLDAPTVKAAVAVSEEAAATTKAVTAPVGAPEATTAVSTSRAVPQTPIVGVAGPVSSAAAAGEPAVDALANPEVVAASGLDLWKAGCDAAAELLRVSEGLDKDHYGISEMRAACMEKHRELAVEDADWSARCLLTLEHVREMGRCNPEYKEEGGTPRPQELDADTAAVVRQACSHAVRLVMESEENQELSPETQDGFRRSKEEGCYMALASQADRALEAARCFLALGVFDEAAFTACQPQPPQPTR